MPKVAFSRLIQFSNWMFPSGFLFDNSSVLGTYTHTRLRWRQKSITCLNSQAFLSCWEGRRSFVSGSLVWECDAGACCRLLLCLGIRMCFRQVVTMVVCVFLCVLGGVHYCTVSLGSKAELGPQRSMLPSVFPGEISQRQLTVIDVPGAGRCCSGRTGTARGYCG